MKPGTLRHLALAVALTLALSLACSAPLELLKATPTAEPPPPTETAEPTATMPPAERVQLDPCTLLSEQEVGSLLGEAAQAQPSMGTGGCTYVLQASDPTKTAQVVLSAAQGNEAKALTMLSMGLLAGFSGDSEIQSKFQAVNDQLPDLTLQQTVTRLAELFRGTGVDLTQADGPDGNATWLVYTNESFAQGTLILVRGDTYVSLTQIGGDMGVAHEKLGDLANTAYDRLPASFYVADEEGNGSFSFSIGGEDEAAPTAAPEPTQPPTEGCVPVLLSPSEGAALDNGCSDHSDPMTWQFSWSACPASQGYAVYVIGSIATIPVIDAQTTATTFTHESVSYVSGPNQLGWRWKVRAMQNGVWGEWSPESTFDVEPVDTDCGTGI